jgi:hypothetical protein
MYNTGYHGTDQTHSWHIDIPHHVGNLAGMISTVSAMESERAAYISSLSCCQAQTICLPLPAEHTQIEQNLMNAASLTLIYDCDLAGGAGGAPVGVEPPGFGVRDGGVWVPPLDP